MKLLKFEALLNMKARRCRSNSWLSASRPVIKQSRTQEEEGIIILELISQLPDDTGRTSTGKDAAKHNYAHQDNWSEYVIVAKDQKTITILRIRMPKGPTATTDK